MLKLGLQSERLERFSKGEYIMYNTELMSGAFAGGLIGLIFLLIIIRFVNRDKKMSTEYDEMQKQIRGIGYKYAFYAMILFEGLMVVLSMGMEIPAESYVVHFFAIFLGVTVQACYCIWNDAYVGLNTNLGRYVIIMAAAAVFNLSISFMAWREGRLFTDGKFQTQTINLLCGLMFVVIGCVGLVKMIVSREEEA